MAYWSLIWVIMSFAFIPGFRPRCSIHHRYNFDQAVLVRYLNPKTAELTGTKRTRNAETHVVEPAIFGLPPAVG